MDQRSPVGTRVLRRINTAAVLSAVRGAAEPVRLTELVELTGLTRPTVTQAVDELLESGWLRQHAASSSGVGGRPAMRVSLNGRAAPVLGLDVGPHTVTAGVADLSGTHLAVVRRPVRGRGAARVLTAIESVVTDVLSSASVSEVAMVAVGTPGIVAADGRVLFAPSIPDWTSIDLVEHLRAHFTCPVQVENDANLAALAHDLPGTLLAVQWGERLGAGVVIDGRLHRGAGEAGEIGFIRPPGVPVTGADDRGPLERTIGAEAIAALARQIAGVRDAAAVFTAAAKGDKPALEVVDQVTRTFAEAIAPAVLVLSPDTVIIGGGVARAGEVLLAAVRRHLAELTLTPPRVELSALAEDTVLTGALRLALDHVWHERLST